MIFSREGEIIKLLRYLYPLDKISPLDFFTVNYVITMGNLGGEWKERLEIY